MFWASFSRIAAFTAGLDAQPVQVLDDVEAGYRQPAFDGQIRCSHAPRGLFAAACSAHIGVVAAAADLLRWGAFSPFVVSREE
jgi:hypothetical protein